MSTDEIKDIVNEKATIVKAILNTRYGGWIAALLATIYVLGNLNTEQFEQAVRLIGLINNDIGLVVLIFIFIIFVNVSFFKPYLKKERLYVETVKEFESTLGKELNKIAERLATLIINSEKHNKESENINKLVEIKIVPAVDKLLTLTNKRAGDNYET